jgi:sulfite reductase (NADPH) flavoprotein alpha-component
LAAVPNAKIEPPLPGANLQALREVVADFDYDQLLWASGYLAGLARSGVGAAVATPQPAAAAGADAWTVFYASETGNARRVANGLAEKARAAGLAVDIQDLADYKPKALAKVANAVFVVPTHGIGEPPDGSELFFEFWLGERAPRLEQLRYSVLALGDSSYADFCVMGQRLDERLRALGATPVVERIDCDVDFEALAGDWGEKVLAHATESARALATPVIRSAHLHAVPKTAAPTRERPHHAQILVTQPITGLGSSKDVRHIELDLEGSGIAYLPGDSLGIVPQNPAPLVEALLETVKLDGAAEVTVNGEAMALATALAGHKEITVLSRPLIETVAQRHEALRSVLSDRERLTEFFATRQVIDLFADYPLEWQPQPLVDSLRRLTPRLYSIASSPDANPDEAHLTVSVVRYDLYGRAHWGAASNFLAGGAETVPVYLEANERFRLPADGDVPVVMVGAGTGVAPYRAFVEHRAEHGHTGDNWLVYGDRCFATDFLYQLEWLRWRKEGVLTHMDVAFSRDGADKVYVQHRLREQSRRLYDWLERGAHFYVCGDAERMAGDVHQALIDVVRKEGGMSEERAQEYVAGLKTQKRYQRDVY